MEEIRVIIQRHRKTHLPNVIFLDDFDMPVEKFLFPSCELMADEVIKAQNWPKDFPMGFHLFHEPHLIVELHENV